MPRYVQGTEGKKEAAPHHSVSAKKRMKLKDNKILVGGGGKRRLIFTFRGGFVT